MDNDFTKNIIRNKYQSIIDNAVESKTPCYIAAASVGITSRDYITTLTTFENDKDLKIKALLTKCDHQVYVNLLREGQKKSYLDLFKPLHALPKVQKDQLPTLRIVFEEK